MITVTALSILLLVYIGYGEAQRTYRKFQLDTFSAQAERAQSLMEDFLKIGLPLTLIKDFLEKDTPSGRFAGFSVFTSQASETDNTNITLTVTDIDGRIVFSNDKVKAADAASQTPKQGLEDGNPTSKEFSNYSKNGFKYAIEENNDFYRLTLPLHNKFKKTGNLIVTLSKDVVTGFIKTKFARVVYAGCVLVMVFSVFVFIFSDRLRRHYKTCMGAAYGATFLIMAVLVVVTLVIVYFDGANAKTNEILRSLTQRLSAIEESGVAFKNVKDLDQILGGYQKSDREIEDIALIEKGIVSIHQDPKAVGQPWQTKSDQYEYKRDIGKSGAVVAVTMQKTILRHKVLHAVKNLITLFVASGFMAFLFFNVATTIQDKRLGIERRQRSCPECIPATGDRRKIEDRRRDDRRDYDRKFKALNPSIVSDENSGHRLMGTMMPVWFLTVFAEALNISFLPKYFQDVSRAAHVSSFAGSILFSAYFAAFAIILVPAGRWGDKWDVKRLLLTGIAVFGAAMVLMGLTNDFYVLFFARLLAGSAHGMVFIGVQTYIQAMSSEKRKTQGAAVIVFSFNGGIISGSAIGALRVADIGVSGIFFCAAAIAAATFYFIMLHVPMVNKEILGRKTDKQDFSISRILDKIKVFARDGEFIRSFMLVGGASKAVYTGVTIFAVPLIMTRIGFAREDIGLALMFYAGTVLFANYYIARLVDKYRNTSQVLFIGVLLSGMGMIFIGAVEWKPVADLHISYLSSALLFGGMILLGVANGAISAPIVTHIMDTRTSVDLGAGSATAVYRLLERIGHVVGPIIVAQMMLWQHQSTTTISLLGFIAISFGTIFFIFCSQRTSVL
jgi:predicted MFS family arabinose efflux permease